MDQQNMAKFEEAKAFIKTLFTHITDSNFAQLKLYLRKLEKDIAAKSSEFFSQYSSVTHLLDTTGEAKGKSALHFAAARGDLEIFKYLVQEYKLDIHIKDQDKNTPFFTAVQHGHLELIKYLVEQLGESVFNTLEGNVSVLHVAANNGALDLLEYFLAKGCDIEKLSSTHGKPIDWAVGSNQHAASMYLLDHGANPNGDRTGSLPAPIFIAIDYGNEALVKKLIQKGADLSVKDPEGSTLLHVACEKGNLPLVKLLIQKGLSLHQTINGKNCYYLAFENGRFEVVEYLKSIIASPDLSEIQKSITEAKAKAEAEKLSKEEVEKRSSEHRLKGNALYGEKKYVEAIEEYSRAIEVDPENNILYSNRAACHLALKDYQKTVEDCGKAKKLNPKHVKTLVREAQAYVGLQNYLEATVSYWEALRLEPSNKELSVEFLKCKELATQQNKAK